MQAVAVLAIFSLAVLAQDDSSSNLTASSSLSSFPLITSQLLSTVSLSGSAVSTFTTSTTIFTTGTSQFPTTSHSNSSTSAIDSYSSTTSSPTATCPPVPGDDAKGGFVGCLIAGLITGFVGAGFYYGRWKITSGVSKYKQKPRTTPKAAQPSSHTSSETKPPCQDLYPTQQYLSGRDIHVQQMDHSQDHSRLDDEHINTIALQQYYPINPERNNTVSPHTLTSPRDYPPVLLPSVSHNILNHQNSYEAQQRLSPPPVELRAESTPAPQPPTTRQCPYPATPRLPQSTILNLRHN